MNKNKFFSEVSSILEMGEMSGRHLRDLLNKCGFRLSAVQFYALISKYEDFEWRDVPKCDFPKEVSNYIIMERRYKLKVKNTV